MLLTKEVTINLNYKETPIVVDALQGDSGRNLVIHLVSGAQPWEVPENAHILIHYQCADRSGGVYDTLPEGCAAYSIQGSAVTVSLIPQLCAVAGCTKLQLTILSDGLQISTFYVEIHVAAQLGVNAVAGDYVNLSQWLNANKKGDTGDSGVYLGSKEPTDPAIRVWIHPEGDAGTGNLLMVKGRDGAWTGISAITGPKGDPGEVTAEQFASHEENADIHASAAEKEIWNNKQDALVDYIVEQGVSGIWSYRKWNSGIAECWGHLFKESIYIGSPLLSQICYYAAIDDKVAFPFSFVENPVLTHAHASRSGNMSFMSMEQQSVSRTNLPAIYIHKFAVEASTEYNITIDFHVTGRWK